MTLQALLVSKDDQASETLIHALSQFQVAVFRSSSVDVAVSRLTEESFDQVIVDFQEPEAGSLILESCRRLEVEGRNPLVTVALLTDASQIRPVLGAGAHFIIIKPVSREQALATLRAATAILKRERRQSLRVAVQVPVSIRAGEETIEGILLDLSAGGLDLLAAKPIATSTRARVSFELPDCHVRVEGDAEIAWSTPNGQIGFRFVDMDSNIRGQMNDWLTAHSGDTLQEEPYTVAQCKLTDLSLGGCYVETNSPFPQSSVVDLCLKVKDIEIHAEGLVRVMHPGHGMGIEFPACTEEQRNRVAEFIDCLSGQPGTQPLLETSPRSLVASALDLRENDSHPADAQDPLLDLLRTGSGMEQEEFLAELNRQRTFAHVGE